MSLGVNLASRELLTAYQAVLNGDPKIDWCLFTYDKGNHLYTSEKLTLTSISTILGTNDLKVQDTGSGGLEALEEEFSDGRRVNCARLFSFAVLHSISP